MKSKISFCNKTVVKNDVIRFWPFWVILFILLQLFGNITLNTELSEIFRNAEGLGGSADILPVVQQTFLDFLFFAGEPLIVAGASLISAVFVFDYLNKRTSSYMIHSLPLRREKLFCSHFLAGFLMLFVPYAVSFLVNGMISLAYGAHMGKAIFAVFLQIVVMILFFYSLSCLIVMVSGSSLMSGVLYGVVNVLVVGINILFTVINSMSDCGASESYVTLIPGSKFLTPVWYFSELLTRRIGHGISVITTWSDSGYDGYGSAIWNADKFQGNLIGVGYLIPACLFFAAAWYLYQKRPLEKVGDTVAFSWCHVVFRIVFSICGSMLFTIIFFLVSEGVFWNNTMTYQVILFVEIVVLGIGGAVSYLIADMILQKSFWIFKKVSWVQMGVVSVCLMALLFVGHQVTATMLPDREGAALIVTYNETFYAFPEGEIDDKIIDFQKEIIKNGAKEPTECETENVEIDFTWSYQGIDRRYNYWLSDKVNGKLIAEIQDYLNTLDEKPEGMFLGQEGVTIGNADIITDTDEASFSLKKKQKNLLFEAILRDIDEQNGTVFSRDSGIDALLSFDVSGSERIREKYHVQGDCQQNLIIDETWKNTYPLVQEILRSNDKKQSQSG